VLEISTPLFHLSMLRLQ